MIMGVRRRSFITVSVLLLVALVTTPRPPLAVADTKQRLPVMHEFTARFFTEQRLTGRFVSDAVPVPNNTLSVEVAFIADPISTAAIVVALLELSFDGGETWRFWMSTGGGSFR